MIEGRSLLLHPGFKTLPRTQLVKNSRDLPQSLQAIFVIPFPFFIINILTFNTKSPELRTA